MKRQQLSGAQKRKQAEEMKHNAKAVVQKMTKLTSFFQGNLKSTLSQNTDNNAAHSVAAAGDDSGTGDARTRTGPIEVNESTSAELAVNKYVNVSGDYDKLGTTCTLVTSVTSQKSSSNCNRGNDPGTWQEFDKDDVAYWIDKGSSDCQHHCGPFPNSVRAFPNERKKTRYCSKSMFYNKMPNGETNIREWLLYSPSTGSLYCFVCKLLSPRPRSSRFAAQGFDDWRNPVVIEQHGKSPVHTEAMLTYLIRREHKGLTQSLDEQERRERNYWRNVLKRVVAVVKTLAERGLPFRGSHEVFGSTDNGNFLGILELISQFDPFLADHIARYGNVGKGIPSYLSKTTCDEIIHLMSSKVRSAILNEVKNAGYFSLSVDSTPDLSHVDQLSVIVRYVCPADGKPVERFLNFLVLKSHIGEDMANEVLQYLCEVCEIDFSKCRGQSYDNAANMSGRYKGMQQKLLEKNKYAIFFPCAAHSLNLVGRSAVDCCLNAVNFFSVVQNLYTFFSASTHRWDVLKSHVLQDKKILKSLSDTRWAAHSAATSAILESFSEIIDALESIADDQSQKGDTMQEAASLANKMMELEFVLMLVIWQDILQHFHKTSTALQQEELNLAVCGNLYQSLAFYLTDMRDHFDKYEKTAKEILPDVDYKQLKNRIRRRRKQDDDGLAVDALEDINARDTFRVFTFYSIIDKLTTEMERRSKVYKDVSAQFSFINNLQLSEEEYFKGCHSLVSFYQEDLSIDIVGELQQFHKYLSSKFQGNKSDFTYAELYDVVVQDKLRTVFPNLDIALRIFLTFMLTNVSSERSFSQIKRLKNPCRTTMKQERLDSLSLLCIEADMLTSVDFDDVIDDFALSKSRKRSI